MKRTFDKYALYDQAVQDPENDIHFLNKEFRRLRGRKPVSLREDFCGTALLSCEWVQQGRLQRALAIDLDPEVITYSRQNHWRQLKPQQQKRVRYLDKNVLRCSGVKADIVVAFNFSHWFFHTRKEMLRYFRSVRRSMKRDSIFVVDTKGGTEALEPRVEKSRFRSFTYYWECKSFNPVNNECHYAIHFKPDGMHLQKNVFTYHWRYWSVPETQEILAEAGFSKSIVYWEGDGMHGEGNGLFEPVKEAENCLIWLAHIVALP